MPTDKEVKAEFKKKAQAAPEKYYATTVLKSEGFSRKRCAKCNDIFWSVNASTCNKVECSGGFTFIGNPPVKKMSYVETWKRFAALFKKLGYTPIKRYPVVARWRDDTDFVQASIYDFQPYVVSGEVEPPANPLVVPQFCLRFNDIDNVGITGSHYTGFVMIGQHAFVPKEKWNQNKIFSDIHAWLVKGLGLSNEQITFHEDAWAGGGNFGPCMEFFSHGLELGNQVYMMYENTPSGYKELKLKVCDMGMGHERNAWFSQGTNTSYDAVFPQVMKTLFATTDLRVDKDIAKKFAYFGGLLNIDEIENPDVTWKQVAKLTGIGLSSLKSNVIPLAALYSVAEHARSLLVAISDGALPSNVGGGYNLRAILRRSMSFIDEYGWAISLAKIARLHAKELKPIFPELSKNIDQVQEILEVEDDKYSATREKSRRIISQVLKAEITESKLLELYDSHGIVPEMIKKEAETLGKKIILPDNFYMKVAELHERATGPIAKMQLPLDDLPETELLYYENQNLRECDARVLSIINNKFVVLDKTNFYPRGGGQEPDHGAINGCRVYDVEKFGNVVVHAVENITFKKGDKVSCNVDWDRRTQLTKHHTAVHIVNAASIKVLGKHIFQAGAKKDYNKAHLDITHYRLPSEGEVERIEKLANSIVKAAKRVKKNYKLRSEAESKYGFKIYQGGAVPGKLIRIVEINHFDVEACGGTHLDNTAHAEEIIITKVERIQDGIVRIELVAGGAARKMKDHYKNLLAECRNILQTDDMVKGTHDLLEKWKHTRKLKEVTAKLSSEDVAKSLKGKFVNNILVEKLHAGMDQLKNISKLLSTEETVIVLFGLEKDKIYVFGSAGQKTDVNIGGIVSKVCSKLGGRGGGGKTLGQGAGSDLTLVDKVVNEIKKDLIK